MDDHDQQQEARVPEASTFPTPKIVGDSSENPSEMDAHLQLDTGKIYEPWLLWIINVSSWGTDTFEYVTIYNLYEIPSFGIFIKN